MFNEKSIIYRSNAFLLNMYREMVKISPNFAKDKENQTVSHYIEDENEAIELATELKEIKQRLNVRNPSVVAEAMVKASFLHPAEPCRDEFTNIVSRTMGYYGETALESFNAVFQLLKDNKYLITEKHEVSFNKLAYQTNAFDQFLALETGELQLVIVKMSSGSCTLFIKWENKSFYAYTMETSSINKLIRTFNVEPEYAMDLVDKSIGAKYEKPLFYLNRDPYGLEMFLHTSIINKAIFSIQTGEAQLRDEFTS